MGKKKKDDISTGGRNVMSLRARIIRWIVSIVLIIYSCVTIFVVADTFLNSLKTKSDLITNIIGFPKVVTGANYLSVLKEDHFLLYFKNSLILTVCGTVGCIILAAMVAYGISRYEFKGKALLSSYFMIGMMVPIQVSVLPLFIIMRRIGLLNRLIGLILVYIAGISMACLIFQKFFRTIPVDLEESARMDGCSDLRTFFTIILPITKPIIFSQALITAIGEWNDFYLPMILLGNKNVRTLTLAIYQYLGQFTKYMSESMAAVIITLIPIVVVYFAFSTQIVEGLTGGAVKG